MEQLYAIKDLVQLLRVNKTTIYRWEKEGKLKFVRINGKPRVTESELKRLMKGE